jgi:hypothetical protein
MTVFETFKDQIEKLNSTVTVVGTIFRSNLIDSHRRNEKWGTEHPLQKMRICVTHEIAPMHRRQSWGSRGPDPAIIYWRG